MSTGNHLHPYLPSGAGKVQRRGTGATVNLFGPLGQTISTLGSEHHAGLTARPRMEMMLSATEEHSSAPRPGARLDFSSQLKEPGDDTAMKTTCLVLLMSGIVPLIQGSNASAASSISHAPYSAAAQNRQRRSSNQSGATSQLLGSVSNVDFGDVNVGSSSPRDVILTNTGSDTVAISNVSVSG